MSGSFRIFLFSLAALCTALILPSGRASAHFIDSDLVVNNVPVGQYHLSVWTVARTLDETSIHITSRLTDPGTGAPVLAANVRYVIRDTAGLETEIISDASPASPVNGFLFEVDVPLPDFGSYRITVEVSDAQDRGGEASYIFPVYPLSTVMRIFVTGLLVIGLLATGWLIREGYLIFNKKGAPHGND